MFIHFQLSDVNLTRLSARVEDGSYPSLDAAANALLTKALDLELPKTVKYDNDRLAMGLSEKEHVNSVFKLVLEQAFLCTDMTPFPVSWMVDRLPQSIRESVTPNMRRLLGGMFHRYAAKSERLRRIGYSSPAVYICTDTFSSQRKPE